MTNLIPPGELTFHDFDCCMKVADILLDEGYTLLVSREESLYVLNYIWTGYADRKDVVFMDRVDFEDKFYTDDDEETEEERRERFIQNAQSRAETEVWHYARRLMNASREKIEQIFEVDELSEEAQDRFWDMYPDQLSYAEVKARFQEYDDLRNAAVGEQIMEACLKDLDDTNKAKYDKYMREQECDTTDYATALNDTLPSA